MTFSNGVIDSQQIKKLKCQSDPKSRRRYILLKMYKAKWQEPGKPSNRHHLIIADYGNDGYASTYENNK